MLQLIEELVKRAKSLCKEVEFCADDATRSDGEFLFRAVETAILAGADEITFCDSSDGMLPEEFGRFLETIYAHVPA
jgi:2-isopropylmalate synthase